MIGPQQSHKVCNPLIIHPFQAWVAGGGHNGLLRVEPSLVFMEESYETLALL